MIEYDLIGPLIRPSSSGGGLSNLKLLLLKTAFCLAGASAEEDVSPVSHPILAESEVGKGLKGNLDHLLRGLRTTPTPTSVAMEEVLLGRRKGSSSGEAQRTNFTAGGWQAHGSLVCFLVGHGHRSISWLMVTCSWWTGEFEHMCWLEGRRHSGPPSSEKVP